MALMSSLIAAALELWSSVGILWQQSSLNWWNEISVQFTEIQALEQRHHGDM